MISGTALAFTRAIAEFGSTVLISGNIPFQTQVAAVHIFGQIESDNPAGAAAVSTLLLVSRWPAVVLGRAPDLARAHERGCAVRLSTRCASSP